MAETKRYIKGSAKAVPTQYGEIINLSLSIDDLNSLPVNKGYIKLSIGKRASEGKYGETHNVWDNSNNQ